MGGWCLSDVHRYKTFQGRAQHGNGVVAPKLRLVLFSFAHGTQNARDLHQQLHDLFVACFAVLACPTTVASPTFNDRVGHVGQGLYASLVPHHFLIVHVGHATIL